MKLMTDMPVRARKPIRNGLVIIACSVVAMAAWAALAPLHGAVMTSGLVKARHNRQAVQHAEGGIITALLVKDGDMVKAGQPIAELDSIGTDASLQLAAELLTMEEVKQARLVAEQRMKADFAVPEAEGSQADAARSLTSPTVMQQAYAREKDLFRSRRQAMEDQTRTLSDQLTVIESEQQALRQQKLATEQGMRLAEDALEMDRSLHQQQFVSKSKLLADERAVVEYEAKRQELEAQWAQSMQRLNDVKLRIASTRNTYVQAAAEEQRESNRRLIELREKLRPLTAQRERTIVRAPIDGKVVGLRYFGTSQVVGPRETILQVVPDSDELVIEGQVGIDDIRSVSVGQPAEIRFTAFNRRSTPHVRGEVLYVSADALSDREGRPYFAVQVKPDSESLRQLASADIQAGMGAEVYLLNEARTTLDFLLAPVNDALNRSMREK